MPSNSPAGPACLAAITIRPKEPERLGEVAAIIGAVAGRRAETRGRDVVTVQVNGDTALNETVRQLEAAGIAVTELALRLPSLDEVFFALTGNSDNKDEEPRA